MANIKITQIKSTNGTNPRQKGTLRTLGLGRIGKSSERTDGPAVRGLIRSVGHLIEVEGPACLFPSETAKLRHELIAFLQIHALWS